MGIASPASRLGFGAIGVLVRGWLAFRANHRAAAADIHRWERRRSAESWPWTPPGHTPLSPR